MRCTKPVSRHIVVANATFLGLVAVLGMAPWAFIAAEASVEEGRTVR